jgi:hypothetical protein
MEGRDQVPQKSPPKAKGRHGGHHCWRTLGHSPRCIQKAKCAAQAHSQWYSLLVPVASMIAQRRTSPGTPGDVSGPLSGTPFATTTPSAQVD